MYNCGQANDSLFNHIMFLPSLWFSGCMTFWKIWQWILCSGPSASETIYFGGSEITSRMHGGLWPLSTLTNYLWFLFLFFLAVLPLHPHSTFPWYLIIHIKTSGIWSKWWLSLTSILLHCDFNVCPYFIFISLNILCCYLLECLSTV